MSICVILAGRVSDVDNGATTHKVMTHRDYLANPALFAGQRPRLINLSHIVIKVVLIIVPYWQKLEDIRYCHQSRR